MATGDAAITRPRRTTPISATVGRSRDVFKDLRQCPATLRNKDIERQASEITRLVRLAERCANDAEKRAQARTEMSTTTAARRPVQVRTGDNKESSLAPCPGKSARNDVILVPVIGTAQDDCNTASTGRRRRGRRTQSPLSLSQFVDVKSLERCPKCHKVRLNTPSPSPDTGTSQRHNGRRRPASATCNPRLVALNTLVGSSTTDTEPARHQQKQSRTTPVKLTDEPNRIRASSAIYKTAPCRGAAVSTTPVSHDQRHSNHCWTFNGVVNSSDGDGRQDVNNNDDCDSGNKGQRLTRNHADSGVSSSSGSGSSQRCTAVRDTQTSLSPAPDSDNNPPSAASSYDSLDTVCHASDASPLSKSLSANGNLATLSRNTEVNAATIEPSDGRRQRGMTSSAGTLLQQHASNYPEDDICHVTAEAAITHYRSVQHHSGVGIPAQLVISIPVISWATRASNPHRRIVCVAPAAAQHWTAVDDGSTSPTHDVKAPRDQQIWQRNESSTYGRSWYDGLH